MIDLSLTTILIDLLWAATVVGALFAAAVILRLIVSAVNKAGNKTPNNSENVQEQAAAPVFARNELKLLNVDEKTAALIMAIVSDESGIPLPELVFTSIKLI